MKKIESILITAFKFLSDQVFYLFYFSVEKHRPAEQFYPLLIIVSFWLAVAPHQGEGVAVPPSAHLVVKGIYIYSSKFGGEIQLDSIIHGWHFHCT